jgi:SAM-dependent methyltransferase
MRALWILVCLTAVTLCGCASDLKQRYVEKVPFYKTATGRFAPVYPALAEQMVQDYGLSTGIAVDVGCGPGSLSIALAKRTQMTIYALDIDSNTVRLCGLLVDEAGLTGRILPIEGDAQNMPFKDDFADFVFSRGSIPFWPDREAGVRECYRILKPGGVAFVGGGFSRTLDPAIRTPLAQERAESMRKRPDPGFRPVSDLDQVAVRAGIPQDQFRFHREPIMGGWLEIRKPAPPGR